MQTDAPLATQYVADSIADRIQDYVFRLIGESSQRLRVAVDTVHVLALLQDSMPGEVDLSRFVKRAFEGEFARPGSMYVLSGWRKPANPDSAPTGYVRPNYVVSGAVSGDGQKLRIDIQCLRFGREQRLLTSKHRIVDSLDVAELSTAVRELAQSLGRAMETDFARSERTLAIVGTTGLSGLDLGEPSSRELHVAREATRAVAQKMRLLAGSGIGLLNVQVLSNLADVARYSRAPRPAPEMLADLDADYLLLMTYQDLGAHVRLTVDLHWVGAERPSIGELVHQKDFDLHELAEEVDSVVLKLTQQLIRHDLGNEGAVATWRAQSNRQDVEQAIREVNVGRVERSRKITFFMGSAMSRTSPELFLGQQTSFYLELGYSIKPGLFRSGGSGGRFDVGIDALLGFESTTLAGNLLSFNGPAAVTGLLNGSVTLTPWAHTATTINVALGGGIGFQALRYNFSPGDIDYAGSEHFREAAFSFVVDAFGRIDFPLSFWRSLSADVTIRWLRGFQEITMFESLPLERFEDGGGPIGKLGGWYIMGGLGYSF